jgi:abequosyltransferase
MQMSDSTSPILTIVIATYNRGRFLRRLLDSITPEVRKYPEQVQILICDDCSTDETPEVISSYVDGVLPFRSIRNDANKGLDGNLLFGFMRATTEYVWLFGDDDVMLEGALDLLVPELMRRRVAFAYIGGYAFKNEFVKKDYRLLNMGPSRLTDRTDLIRTAHCLLTFITRGIINKKAVLESQPGSTFDQYMGTIINQMSFVFGAIKTSLPCLIIAENMIASQLDNSGGYAACTSFGPVFRDIVMKEFPGDPSVWQTIGNSLLETYFPNHLYQQRGVHRYKNEDCMAILIPVFGKNYRFWLYCYPIAVLPKSLAKLYSLSVRSILKAKRTVRSVWWSILYTRRKISVR